MSIKRPDQGDVDVGATIRMKRHEHGLSQTDLARRLGITFQQVQKYEKGVNRVGAGRVMKIAEIFGCAPADLLPVRAAASSSPATDAAEPVNMTSLLQTAEAVRMLKAFAMIRDPLVRRSLRMHVEAIAFSKEEDA